VILKLDETEDLKGIIIRVVVAAVPAKLLLSISYTFQRFLLLSRLSMKILSKTLKNSSHH
jgi:hypothetical protein